MVYTRPFENKVLLRKKAHLEEFWCILSEVFLVLVLINIIKGQGLRRQMVKYVAIEEGGFIPNL